MTISTTDESTSTPNTNPASDWIDDYATARVDYHVARLGRQLHLPDHRRDDLRQNLFLALCKAAPRYDARQSSRRTFVSRVLSRAAAHHARSIRNERASSVRSPLRFSELERNGHSFAPVAPRSCEPSAHELVLDLRHALASLSREHQQLAEALKTQTPAEIAAERGVHRCTVYREIAALRSALSEAGLDPTT